MERKGMVVQEERFSVTGIQRLLENSSFAARSQAV
jgi:hypothetical protein